MWSHPNVLEEVKDHLRVFEPNASFVSSHCSFRQISNCIFGLQVLPHIVQWTSYGLCSMLDCLYTRYRSNLKDGVAPEPYWIEVVGALERALNFCHTGNAKVLTKGVMDPLWLSLSCVLDGMPALSDIVSLRYLPSLTVDIRRADWPLSKTTGRPLMTSQRVFQLNFGPEQMAVSDVCI